MADRKMTLNAKVGLCIALLSVGGFAYTFYSPLRQMELFIPRIALALLTLGGILIILKDQWFPEQAPRLPLTGVLPYGVAIAGVLWLYGWSFRNIGLITSTFGFLAAWWLYMAYREAKRKGSFEKFGTRVLKMMILAAVVAGTVHFLFITLLSMYLPRTPLP